MRNSFHVGSQRKFAPSFVALEGLLCVQLWDIDMAQSATSEVPRRDKQVNSQSLTEWTGGIQGTSRASCLVDGI